MGKNGYIEKQAAIKALRRDIHDFERAKVFDAAIMALGHMGLDPDFLHTFRDKFLVTEAELEEQLGSDYLILREEGRPSKANRKVAQELKFAMSKKAIDGEILLYIHPEDYLEFDYRYKRKPIPEELRKDIYGIS